MAQSIVGLENVQPYKFSECSKNDYIEALKSGHGICLFNKPNEVNRENLYLRLIDVTIELERRGRGADRGEGDPGRTSINVNRSDLPWVIVGD